MDSASPLSGLGEQHEDLEKLDEWDEQIVESDEVGHELGKLEEQLGESDEDFLGLGESVLGLGESGHENPKPFEFRLESVSRLETR